MFQCVFGWRIQAGGQRPVGTGDENAFAVWGQEQLVQGIAHHGKITLGQFLANAFLGVQ